MSGSAILTNNGLLKIASASPLDQLTITQIAIGDGVNPLDPNSTALVNEVYRDTASTPIRSTTYPNTLVFELNIPPTTGGFTCREIGAFDTDGDLIAVGTLDELVKPTDGINYVARINVRLANTSQVDVFYDNQGAIDHSGLRNRNEKGAHDKIYTRRVGSVSVMQAESFTNDNIGERIKTDNYYDDGYGGGGKYKIEAGNDADGWVDHNLGNNLKAVLQIGNEVDVKQVGCQCWSDRNVDFDNKAPFLALLNKIAPSATDQDIPIVNIVFGGGIWQFSATRFSPKNGAVIKGSGGWSWIKSNSTYITCLNDNQDYVWKIGGLDDPTVSPMQQGFDEDAWVGKYQANGNVLEGITFSTMHPNSLSNPYSYDTIYSTVYSALYLDFFNGGELKDIRFMHFDGTGLTTRDVWETEMDIMFRDGGDKDKAKFVNEENSLLNGQIYGNVSAIKVSNFMCESVNGDWFLNKSTRFTNVHFDLIQGEFSPCTRAGTDGAGSSFYDIDPSSIPTYTSWSVIKNMGSINQVTVDAINVQKVSSKIVEFADTSKYILDTLMSGGYNNVNISNIVFDPDMKIDPVLIRSASANQRALLTVGSITGTAENNVITKYPIVDVEAGNVNLISIPKLDIAKKFPVYDGQVFAADVMTTGYNRTLTDKTALNPRKLVIGKWVNSIEDELFRIVRPVNYNQAEAVTVRFKAPNGQAYRLVANIKYEGADQFMIVEGTGTGDWEEALFLQERRYADDGLWIFKDESTLDGVLFDCVSFELKSFTQRPTSATHKSKMFIGAMVYDKAIDKPIYLDDNKTDWKDATGAIV